MTYASDFEPILRKNLIKACHALMLHTMETPTAFSRRVFGDGSFLKRWRDGENGFSIRVYDECMRHVSHVWEDDADWPSDVPRPAPAERVVTQRPRPRKTKDA